MNIKPGDLFEWVYKGNNAIVLQGEQLYSDSMKKWITCSGLCLCIGTNKDIIHWVSDVGLFRAHLRCPSRSSPHAMVIPRKI